MLDLLAQGKIEKGHAKLLASMSPGEAETTAKKIVNEKISDKDFINISTPKKTKTKNKTKDTDLLNIEKEMSELLVIK